LLSLVNAAQLRRILDRMLDPDQFLSEYGLRSLSKEHAAHPYTVRIDGTAFTVRYEPDDTGAGLGASHQTGWTALVAKLIQQSGGL